MLYLVLFEVQEYAIPAPKILITSYKLMHAKAGYVVYRQY